MKDKRNNKKKKQAICSDIDELMSIILAGQDSTDWKAPWKKRDVYGDIFTAMNAKFQPEKLKPVLLSNNETVSLDGLFILSELPAEYYVLINYAVENVGHSDWTARAYLASCLIRWSKHLSVVEMEKMLVLISDDKDFVREEMLQVLSVVPQNQLKEAINEISDSSQKALHLEGWKILNGFLPSKEKIIEFIETGQTVLLVYACAHWLKVVREGGNVTIPEWPIEYNFLKRLNRLLNFWGNHVQRIRKRKKL